MQSSAKMLLKTSGDLVELHEICAHLQLCNQLLAASQIGSMNSRLLTEILVFHLIHP